MRTQLCTPIRLASSLLVISAVLAGCGGGTDKTPTVQPPPPPPPGPVEVSFTSPVEANNVYDVNTPVTLQVSVRINGATAPNGTPVVLQTASSASLAPTAPTTLGGAATSTLQGTAPGLLKVLATVTSNTQSTIDTLTLYLRPSHAPLEMLVPANFAAGKDSPWDTLKTSAVSYPAVKITAIANPSNGALTATSTVVSDLATAIKAFKDTGTNRKVVAYVATAYGSGTRSEADIKATIDKYLELYPNLDGFFLSEMATGSNRQAFYAGLYSYIKDKKPAAIVIGDPGTYPDATYATAADTLVTFEGNASAYQNVDPQQSTNTWVYNRANSAQAMLVHGAVSCTSMQDTMKTANRARNNTGVVYAAEQPINFTTNAGALPSYWLKLLGTVDALNKNLDLPAC